MVKLSNVTPQQSNLVTSIENFINTVFHVGATPVPAGTQPSPSLNYDWISIGAVGLVIVGVAYAVKKKKK